MTAPQSTLQALAAPAEALQVAQQLALLHAAAIDPKPVGNATFVMVPPGFSHQDISAAVEKALPAPTRKRGTVALKDIPSFVEYLKDQAANSSGIVYADPDTRTITAVFNDHRASVAGWRDNRATFKAEYTPEFERWLANNGGKSAREQTTFAEFIEDNMADIAEPEAHKLLEVATTIQATTGIEFKSAKRLQDGQVQLTYNETVDARAGADGAITIPKEFALGVRIFKNGEGYRIRARLKYRLTGGGVKFWYEMDRPERAIEDAFAGYIEKVREGSGYIVLLGAAG